MNQPLSKDFGVGVVVGKFYPFHRGHKYLIETALERCESVFVIVTEEQDQAYSATERADWIYSEFYNEFSLYTLVTPNNLPNEPGPWAERTRNLVPSVEAVFTSESYGPPWAEALGVEHVHVDMDRRRFPTSGTEIRADILSNWHWLADGTKAALAPLVVAIGAESTGSTTISKYLASYYGTAWVPEFGREWWDARWFASRDFDQYDFDRIIDGQNYMTDRLRMLANKVLISDTDNLATVVFEERYLGRASDRTLHEAKAHLPDLYLVTDTDIPWVNDGMRESEKERDWMQARMLELVEQSGVPYIVLSGDKGRRANDAIKRIDQLLVDRFGDPLPITEVL